MRMTGAQALLKCLQEEGVDIIFGFPGGAVIPIYDALFDSEIRHVLVRHEQGAAFMAGGYARATGRVGVALATSGPGVTNLVTGIADCYMDSVPVVFLTGQVSRSMIGRDAFQETDATGITMPIVKHSYLVQDVHELPVIVKEAFHIARSGRPGPVLIDIPKDVSYEQFDFNQATQRELRGYQPIYVAQPEVIQAAADLINQSERPLLYLGGGTISSGASEEVIALAEAGNIPAAWTLMGKGAIPESHPLAVGMLGMHGAAYANYAIGHCDAMIALGARFDDRVTGKLSTFAPTAKVLHVDIDPAEIGKNRRPDLSIQGDVKQVLQQLLPFIRKIPRTAWLEQIEAWKRAYPLNVGDSQDGRLKPQHVLQALNEVTRGQAIVATDVGQHQMWAAQLYRVERPRQFLTSGGLGAMGFGLPTAIGAQMAFPEAEVWCITGDGSIQMNIQEMATAVLQKLPIKIAIINNGYLGMVRQWQELFHNSRYSETYLATVPDWVKLAEAYGAAGRHVTRPEEVLPALRWAQQISDRPTILNFQVVQEENVFPMVPAGGDTSNPWLGPEDSEMD
jgi:acetolactate synthase-1/2/3 large subunit